MATFTFDELVTPISREDFETSIYDTLGTVGVSTASWRPGAVLRSIITIASVCLAALSVLVSSIARSGFLSLASGIWLKLHARHFYKIEPADATYAQGYISVSNSSGGIYEFDPDDFTVANSSGAEYRNTERFVLKNGATSVPVLVRAVKPGSASSALVGEVTTVVTGLSGVTCTNSEVFIGLDAEDDDLIRLRCGESLGGLSPNGPADAYSTAARATLRPDGTNVGVTRVRTRPTKRGGVQVFVATPNGAVPGDIPLSGTDLALVDQQLRRYALPEGVALETFSVTEKPIDVTVKVWVKDIGLSDSDITAGIANALKAFFASPLANPIGGATVPGCPGAVIASDLSATIMRARTPNGAVIQAFRADITPSKDVELGFFELAQLGAVRVEVVQVAQTASAL